MKMKHNSFSLSDSEMAHINEMRLKHTVVDNFLYEACAYILTLGVKVEMTEIPDRFRLDGEFGPGWYGEWAGSYTNLINDIQLYSGTPVFDGNWAMYSTKDQSNNPKPLDSILLGHSGCGGGGSSFKYQNGFIAIETLPKLKNKMFSELAIKKATEDLNSTVKAIESKFNMDSDIALRLKKEKSDDYQYLSRKIDELDALSRELLGKRQELKNKFEVEAAQENAVKLPPITDSLLDLSLYHKVQNRLDKHTSTELEPIDLSSVANKIYTVIDEFPHKFL